MKYKSKFSFIFLLSLSLIGTNSCQKKAITTEETQVGTVTDVDGNVYKTVKIGSQWWMAENLKVTVYNDSTPILNIPTTEKDTVWSSQKEGAYCSLDERYGLSYNWFAVNNVKKLAPKGWHIPSDEEWKILEKEIGMSETEVEKTGWRGTDEAEKLIVKSSVGWVTSDIFGSNTVGFTALPGGCRVVTGETKSSSTTAFWWTSTEKGTDVYYRYIDATKKNIFRHFTYKTYGFNVRCIKD